MLENEVEASGGTPPAEGVPMPIVARRALAAPVTVNREARTVEVIWAAGARAPNWVSGLGCVIEELDMSPNAVRMETLRSGRAPVLDAHNSWGARSVLGVVENARIEGGRGLATLRFSTADDVKTVWQRVLDGTLRSVSVGYRIHRYEQKTDPATGQIIHRAVDWEPYEISVVPIPVDQAAVVRGEAGGGRPVAAIEPPIPEEDNIMPETPDAAADTARTAPAATITPATHAADSPSTPAFEGQRAQQPDAVQAALVAERSRVNQLDEVIVAAQGLVPPAEMTALRARAVSEGWQPTALRGALFDVIAARGAPPSLPASPNSGPAQDDPAVIRDAMAEAIAVRAMPGYQPKGNGRHVEFLGWRPSDMIRELLARSGERSPPRNPTLLAERAFHTTSDFPLLLSSATNKMLLASYAQATPTYREIMLRRDFRDFKPHRYLRVGDFPNLLALKENGEIQVGTIGESRETVTLGTFGRRVRVTRQMLVDDDLGAFTDFASMIGQRVTDFENATAYAQVNLANGDGPTLETPGGAVFGTGAARANKASAGTAIDEVTIGAGRAAMMRQKTLDGMPISLGRDMRVLVGPALELAVLKLTTAITPSSSGNVNPYARLLQPVVEPLIPANRWYLFANPVSAPVYTYGYLNGAEGPQVTTGPVQGADGVEISVIFDFGVGAIDFRGAWFNPGT
jgi:hypothetical protein